MVSRDQRENGGDGDGAKITGRLGRINGTETELGFHIGKEEATTWTVQKKPPEWRVFGIINICHRARAN